MDTRPRVPCFLKLWGTWRECVVNIFEKNFDCTNQYVVKRYCILQQNLSRHRPYQTLPVPENQLICNPIKTRTIFQILCSRAFKTQDIKLSHFYKRGPNFQVLTINLCPEKYVKIICLHLRVFPDQTDSKNGDFIFFPLEPGKL